MTGTPILDSMAMLDEDAHFRKLESRLVDEYGTERRAVIHTMVARQRKRFDGARVHAFLPILVERSVRFRLRA